jgi:adhesin/invasin
MAFSLMLSLSSTANANALAGGGWSSSYSGESVFTNQPAGGSGQFSAIFFNDGTQTWAPGVVGLLVCLADKTTCNVTSPNAAYASGWFSATVYATVSATVPPGSNGFFIYNFVVPAGTAAGTVATFNGDVGLIASGLELRPQGYFQINTTPGGSSGGMTLTPTSASLPVGGTQQFTANNVPAGATVSWSVTGGCGAITSAGLFAATATNSATQPCSVVATAGAATASAPVNVFGPATQIACSANPTSVSGNGVDTTKVSATLKDANGNTVTNASGTSVNFNNNTPTVITPTGQTVAATANGVATVVYTTVAGSSGTAQVSVASGSLTGCNQTVTVNAIGSATKTTSTFSPGTIAADGTSMARLRVIVTDANGNAITTDNSTTITVSRSSGASVCTPGSLPPTGTTTVAAGTANFTITSTTTPGTCSWDATTNNTSIAGSSATLTTIIVGAPNKLAASTSQSPATAGCQTTDITLCPFTVITVQDANGNRITNPSFGGQAITASFAGGTSCTGVGATPNPATTGTTPSTAGRATFTFTSLTATTGCTVTFTPGGSLAGVSTTTTSVVFTPGAATKLICSFTPASIFADGSSTSTASVKVADANDNPTNAGTYSISFSKTSGTAGTVLLTSSPQNTTNGVATFTVRSTSGTLGTDTYTATGTVVGTTTSSATCNVSTK